MPTQGSYSYQDANPRQWERCKQQIATAMIAEGWNRHAGKFNAVRDRRARRLLNQGK